MTRYRLVEQIGKGSAGTIFVGEYGALNRPVAIKILHRHLVGDPSGDRMLAEARTLSLVDHPGVVKVIDVGTVRGRAFIVMERLVGESLSVRLARERLSEQRVVMYARQLACALEAAHAVGVVHRDLKPDNILLVSDPEVPGGERVKIIDFGIAKRSDQERTKTGIVLGTPNYMAPEQWSRIADPRSDVYALGVVIYVMATGELPFSGSTGELIAEHVYCAPPRAVEAGVSSWLSSIIERCLAKDPSDRFPTMAALGGALRELEEAIAPPTGPVPRYVRDDWDLFDGGDDDEETIVAPRARGTARRPAVERPASDSAGARRQQLIAQLRKVPRWPLAVAVLLLAVLLVQPATNDRWLHRGISAGMAAEPTRTLKKRWLEAERETDATPLRRSQRQRR